MARLQTNEVFPAGVGGIRTRMVDLSTGVRLRIAESGPEDGAPLVMLHGWASSLYMFRHALTLLPQWGIRAIAVDLRGYGLSDHPRARGAYTLEAYLADLHALLDALELPTVSLMGQSMGGGIALHHALRAPQRVRRLVLINPVGLVPIPWVSLVRLVPRRLMNLAGERFLFRSWCSFVLRHIAFGNPSAVSERDVDENWALTQVPGFVHAVGASMSEFNWTPLTTTDAAALTVPTLAVLGTRDRVVRRAQSAAAALNGARLVWLDGGHCVHEEYPNDVYKLVGEFLAPR